MKKIPLQYSLLLLLLLCNFRILSAQISNVAQSDVLYVLNKQLSSTHQEEQQTLKGALISLERKYKVSLLYKTEFVENKLAPKNVQGKNFKSLEEELVNLLKPNHLKYEKIQSNFYVISPETAIQPMPVESSDTSDGNGQTEETYLGKVIPVSPLLLKLASVNLSHRQKAFSVTGKVTSSLDNEKLPGVNVLVKGTSKGTVTDVDGFYRLEVPSAGSVIVFSSVGFISEEIVVGNETVINMTLNPDIKSLQEVVVIGYGTQKKSDVTGSVSSINTKDFQHQPLVDASQTLKGLAAGVAVQNVSGQPGGDVKIRIRGVNSLIGGSSPLFVVDGIQMVGVGLNELNPNDIESMEVLKDASASAIYGSRGANGVVLITTKRGASGQPKVEVNSFVSFKNSTDYYEPTSVGDYIKAANYILPGSYSQADSIRFMGQSGTDWQKLLVRPGFLQSHQVAVSGGSESTKYFFSGNYTDEKGVLINSTRTRINFRANVESKLTEKLTMGIGLNGSRIKGHNLSSRNGNIHEAITMSPTTQPRNPDGTYTAQDPINYVFGNPYRKLNELFYDETTLVGMVNATLSYKILDDLTFNSIAGFNIRRTDNGNFNNTLISPAGASAGRGFYSNENWQFSNTLTYEKTLGEIHRFSVMAGFEESNSVNASFGGSNSQLQTESGGYNNLSIGTAPQVYSSFDPTQSLRSYLGRATYSLKDRYLLTATIRRDGSSKFRGDNKWSTFSAVAVGWRLSEESFIKDLNIFDNLKLRASYGDIGNQAIGPYGTSAILEYAGYRYGTQQIYPGYLPRGSANPDLRWETVTTSDIGLDASFFKSRLNITLDYYNKVTKDLLQYVDLPLYTGGGTKPANVGSVGNKGFEFTANVVPVESENLRWDFTFNFWTGKNKVLSLGEIDSYFPSTITTPSERPNQFIVKTGEPMGAFWGYRNLGIWQAQDESTAAAFGQKVGQYRYEDLNNDQKIDSKDLQIIGYSLPTARWGFNTNLAYKRFTVNAFFEGVTGASALNYPIQQSASVSRGTFVPTIAAGLDYWTPTNPDARFADPKNPASDLSEYSSQFVQNANFIKLRNVSLSYDIPKTVIKVTNVRINLSAQNVFRITKFEGADPENTFTGESDTYGGYNAGSYPSVRSFTVGLLLGL